MTPILDSEQRSNAPRVTRQRIYFSLKKRKGLIFNFFFFIHFFDLDVEILTNLSVGVKIKAVVSARFEGNGFGIIAEVDILQRSITEGTTNKAMVKAVSIF